MRVLTADEIDCVSAGPTGPVDVIPAVVVTETLKSAVPAIPPQTFPFPAPFGLRTGV